MDRLNQELQKYNRVLIDTNLFIYLMEKNPKYFKIVKEVFNKIEKGQVYGITSILLLTEILTKPIREGNENLVRSYKIAIDTFPNLSVVNMDFNIAVTAAKLKAKYGFKTPDAIFMATGINQDADVFITNDIRLKAVEELNCIIIEDYI